MRKWVESAQAMASVVPTHPWSVYELWQVLRHLPTCHTNKTRMLMMSRKKNLNPQGDVIFRNEAIQRVTKAKFLGVIVDQHLNWKDHIYMFSIKV